MTTKISIIDVDLNVESIINDEIIAITGATKTILEDFRESQLETAHLKQCVDNATKAAKTKLLAAIEALIDAGPSGIPVTVLYTLTLPEINTITLTTRIKTQLKTDGNKWALMRKKTGKTDKYILIPYNQDKPQ